MTSATGPGPADGIEAVLVVVPVNDEEELLAGCLDALLDAVGRATEGLPGVDVTVTVVLDACTDRSIEIAERYPFRILPVARRSVGAARAAGVADAMADLARRRPHVPPEAVWLASTDADSRVPAHWVVEHAAVARTGVDLLVGTVRPDFSNLTTAQREAWSATHAPGVANGHVHGANLGLRASVYLAAGGYLPIAEHEDVELVAAVRRAGFREVATDRCWVLTSGRATGRTPGGYARHLRESLVPAPARQVASSR